jgi:hypothetical protein
VHQDEKFIEAMDSVFKYLVPVLSYLYSSPDSFFWIKIINTVGVHSFSFCLLLSYKLSNFTGQSKQSKKKKIGGNYENST